MTPLQEHATEEPLKASFKIKTDTNAWEFVHRSSPYIETVFDFFPDLEAIELQFVKDPHDPERAFLSHVPIAWVRIEGELEAYKPDDDGYGLSCYLLEIGDEMSPLPLSIGKMEKHIPKDWLRFSFLITASACLLRNPKELEDALEAWDPGSEELALQTKLSGFTSPNNPGGAKVKRLHAQMHVVCEILEAELSIPVEFERISGALGEK